MPVTYLPLTHFTPVRWSDREVRVMVRSQPAPRYKVRARCHGAARAAIGRSTPAG